MSSIRLKKLITKYITSPIDCSNNYFTQFAVNSSEIVYPTLISDYFYAGCSYEIKINSAKIINTIKGTSIEGQCLTGKKLAITGTLNLTIIFKHKKAAKSCYILNETIPFNTFIIIPEEICDQEIIELAYYIEDVDVVALCKNKLFISAMLLLKYDDLSLC